MEKDFSFSSSSPGVSCNIHRGQEAWEEIWHTPLAAEMSLYLQNNLLLPSTDVNNFSTVIRLSEMLSASLEEFTREAPSLYLQWDC